VLANGIEANGRLLGLVYAGDTTMADGSRPFVDEAMLGQSVNAKLVAAGLAYVEPYDSMPISLVQHLRTIITIARAANMGLLGMENVSKTQSGRVPDIAMLQTLVMWPKLFRRLTAYFRKASMGSASSTTGCGSTRSIATIRCDFRMARRETCTMRIEWSETQ